MAFFEDWGKKLSDAVEATADKAKEMATAAADKAKDVAAVAADKAKDMSEIAKLNAEIAKEKKKMTELYLELGKQIFEQEKDKEESLVKEQCEKILSAHQNITACQEKIQTIKDNDPDITIAEEDGIVVDGEIKEIAAPPAEKKE